MRDRSCGWFFLALSAKTRRFAADDLKSWMLRKDWSMVDSRSRMRDVEIGQGRISDFWSATA